MSKYLAIFATVDDCLVLAIILEIKERQKSA